MNHHHHHMGLLASQTSTYVLRAIISSSCDSSSLLLSVQACLRPAGQEDKKSLKHQLMTGLTERRGTVLDSRKWGSDPFLLGSNRNPGDPIVYVKSSQVVGLRDRRSTRSGRSKLAYLEIFKSSQVVVGATHSRSEHPDPNLFLPPPLRGLWRGLRGVGR